MASGAEVFDGAIVVCGPTASGKSAFAVDLAELLDGEIVGADSQQVYRGLAVGTAQPSAELRARVPHHLVGFVEPPERMTAARWAELARAAAVGIRARGKAVVLCGGTGLYLRAALAGLFEGPQADLAFRAGLEAEAAHAGRPALHARLAAVAPESAARLSPTALVRVIRAIEIHARTGEPMSRHLARQPRREAEARWLGIAPPREALNQAIDARTERIYREGLLEEARSLRERGLTDWAPAHSLGYRDALAHLDGRRTLAEARERTARDTRRYAKRQLTWFRAMPRIAWLPWPPRVEEARAFVAGGKGAAREP